MLPSQPQASEIKPFDSSVELVSLPSIGRKPVGAQSGQPASQSPVGMAQTTHEKSQAQNNSIAARHSTPTHNVVASARPVLALAQTPPPQASPSSKPITVQKPVIGHTQPSQKPVPSQQTFAAPKQSTQRPAIIQKPVTTRTSSQKARHSPPAWFYRQAFSDPEASSDVTSDVTGYSKLEEA
ncbi:hypothetical protein FPOA_04011 [Fusarium poae]|uniref:Uncharacterized protein n=1 Tax=Fusarium poae TaxID=36050 RepID=A0A1B8ASF6_FUSPO|nr:hypothetical protein FPOA_04011 [Fusarium poae]